MNDLIFGKRIILIKLVFSFQQFRKKKHKNELKILITKNNKFKNYFVKKKENNNQILIL
jgi:hypothetical protein